MFGYVTIGTNDLERAVAFYDALLGELGARRFAKTEGMAAWGVGSSAPKLMVTRPFDGDPATVGNGVMLAIDAADPSKVDAIYEKAMELGATDEGPPGPRGSCFYAAYFRDPDGNKLNASCSVTGS